MVPDEADPEHERNREIQQQAASAGVAASHGFSSGSPWTIFTAVQTSTPAPT